MSTGIDIVRMKGLYDLQQVSQQIGKGGRSYVRLVKHRAASHVLALKVVDMGDSASLQRDMRAALTECHVHRVIDHPNVIRYRRVYVQTA